MGIGAIGSSAGAAAAAAVGVPARRPANLDGDLAKYEGQLSDWTYCASGKTPEGKVKIAQISDKISTIKAQMHQADQASAAAKAVVAKPAAPASTIRVTDVVSPNARTSAATTALGGTIDVYV